MIASTNALPFESEMKGAKKGWIYTLPLPPRLSLSLSSYQMYASLGRARHMEMEPWQMGGSPTGSPDD